VKKDNFKSIFSIIAVTLLFSLIYACGAGPLTRGSATFLKIEKTIGYSLQGTPLNPSSFSGKPFVIFITTKWCPPCRETAKIVLDKGNWNSFTGKVDLVVLELVDGTLLEEGKITRAHLFESYKVDYPITGWDNLEYYRGDSETIRKTLKLKRVPAVVGFNEDGEVAATIYGLHTDLRSEFASLLEKITSPREETKEEISF
jgi:thiol-disulfide isomerase/thioredoxin